MTIPLLYQEDCIAAIATGMGGSITIIRISGQNAKAIVRKVWKPNRTIKNLHERKLVTGRIVNDKGATKDHCLTVFFPGPNSYTGEDLFEFHCHGGLMVARSVLTLLLQTGARHAEPGEFTKRAFLNGKMDLTQAEAVLDIIQSQSTMALHAANRQLDGVLNQKVNSIYDTVVSTLSEIEVRMDFSDEDLDWEPVSKLSSDIEKVLCQVGTLIKSRHEGEILRNGINAVIVGVPNAGKSSLLNYILGRNRAIVTDIPGTTRDTLEESVQIRGIPIRLIDTAGFRESEDLIEMEGISRSMASIETAHLVLWVIDSTADLEYQKIETEFLKNKAVVAIANKIDIAKPESLNMNLTSPLVKLSALTGEGMEELYDSIENIIWQYPHSIEPEVAVSSRHCSLLEIAQENLTEALAILPKHEFELIAINLRSSINALGKITGKTVQPDILDSIFSKFCIGK